MAKKLLFSLDVDTLTANHVVNPQEFFSKALIGTERSTSYFRPFLDVNSKIKVGSLEFDDVIQEAGCDFTATNADLGAKSMEPEKLQLGVELCQYDLQNSFIAQYMRNGNQIDFANTSGLTPEFLTHYYERLGAKLDSNLENLTWKGNKSTGVGYLNLADGLETKLATGTVEVPSPIAITASNVIAEMTKAYQLIPPAIDKSQMVWFIPSNVASAYKVAVATASAEVYTNKVPELKFIDVKLVEAKGMTSSKMVLSRESNFIFMTDLVSPASDLITINMKATTGDRKVRTISDFTFGVDFVNAEEFVTYGL